MKNQAITSQNNKKEDVYITSAPRMTNSLSTMSFGILEKTFAFCKGFF